MYAHMEAALRGSRLREKGRPSKSILRSFRRLFGRTGLMQKEINMLRGIYTQIENRAVKSKRDD